MYKDKVEKIEIRIRGTKSRYEHALELFINGDQVNGGYTELHPEKLFYLLNSPERYGQQLGGTIFRSGIGSNYSDAVIQSQFNEQPVPLHLTVHEPELQEIRWEWMAHRVGGSWRPLALDPRVIFSRFVTSEVAFAPQETDKVNALFVISSPSDLGRYRSEPIPRGAGKSIENLLGRQFDDVTVIGRGEERRPTLGTIVHALREEKYQVLQILCHALPISGDICLLLEDDAGRTHAVGTDLLLSALGQIDDLPALTILSVSEAKDQRTPEAGARTIAWVLAANNKSAAVVTIPPSMPGAEAFFRGFYKGLTQFRRPDFAVRLARQQLSEDPSFRNAWGLPALFMRTQDVLWQEEGQEEEVSTGQFIVGDYAAGTLPSKKDYVGTKIRQSGGVNIRGGGELYIDIGGSNIGQKSITGTRGASARPESGVDAVFDGLLEDLNDSDNEIMKPIAETQLTQLRTEAEKGDDASWAAVENGLNMLAKIMPDLAAKAIDRFSRPDSGLPTVFSSVAGNMQDD